MDFLKTLLPNNETSKEQYEKSLRILKEVYDALNAPNPNNKWWIVVVDPIEFEEEAFFGPEEKAKEYFKSYRPYRPDDKYDENLIKRMIDRIKARARFGDLRDLSPAEKDLATRQGVALDPQKYTDMRVKQLQSKGISETTSFLDHVIDSLVTKQITEDIMDKHGNSVVVFLNNILKHYDKFYSKFINDNTHPLHDDFLRAMFDLCDALYVYKARYHTKGVTPAEQAMNFSIDALLKKLNYRPAPRFSEDNLSERSVDFLHELVSKFNPEAFERRD
jgi:hypothetical protein